MEYNKKRAAKAVRAKAERKRKRHAHRILLFVSCCQFNSTENKMQHTLAELSKKAALHYLKKGRLHFYRQIEKRMRLLLL